jgi:hypothetical protein
MNVLWNQRDQVAKDRETMDLQLLELWWLPSVELGIVGMGVQVHQDAV